MFAPIMLPTRTQDSLCNQAKAQLCAFVRQISEGKARACAIDISPTDRRNIQVACVGKKRGGTQTLSPAGV